MAYGSVNGANTSDRSNCGSPAGLDNLSAWTLLFWVRVTTLTNLRALWSKSGATFATYVRLNGTGGNIEVVVDRATTNTQYITNSTPLSGAGTWKCIAVTFDIAAGAGEVVNIYMGTLAAAMAEATYGTATDGSGALNDDSANDFVWGNRGAAFTTAIQADRGPCSVYNSALSSGDVERWRLRTGRILPGCLGDWIPGNNGSATPEVDLTGNGYNGTVTGATAGGTQLALALHGRLTGQAGASRSLVGRGLAG